MRKIVFGCLLCIFLFILGCSTQTYQTVEDSMKVSNISYSEIINEEDYGENGKIVFYRVSNPEKIGIGYLEGTSLGYKWIDGVELLLFEDLQMANINEKITWISSYQIKTKKIATEENLIPIYMGLVIDPNIEKVIVKAELGTPFSIKEDITVEARILQYKDSRIWYVLNPKDNLMKLYQGPFKILGLSKDGDTLTIDILKKATVSSSKGNGSN
ncbi:hypothetical protein [Desulfosporosinus sp.]|uniref:hypothetical protein n=1 Tax=Desulfosporosinus sp. TaxID=157907 RepID=UPI0025B7F11A|nr:hypothetical protein [Desulfosporosinus sp.]MBC2727611.1 hypothetical protein [Desulfosporosinus sp.]